MSKRGRSPDRDCGPQTPQKRLKQATKFNSDWTKEYGWVQRSDKGAQHLFCTACHTHVSIKSGGLYDLKHHQTTMKHQNNVKCTASIPKVSSMFAAGQTVTDKVTKAELLFANFVAEHNIPFLAADHFSELVKVMFPDSQIAQKFKAKRTKTTHIVTQALAPALDSAVTEMCRTQKFSLLVDESNNSGGEKTVAVLVRVFDTTVRRVATRFLDLPVCNIGTGANIFNCLNEIFVDRNIPWSNCVGYSSDNASVMVGRSNSVLSRVREKNPQVYDMGCVCHLANIVTQHAVKTLPVPVEELLIDIFFHFHHSAKRKEEYKEFLDFTDTEPLKIVKHCSTRWLSLERSVKRVLQQWPALKSYFVSHEDVEKSGRVKRCADQLSSQQMWLHLAFLEFILPILNEFNTMFQSGEAMIGHLSEEMVRLLRKLMGKFVTTQTITQHSDLATVPYKDRANQHPNSNIAVGWTARNFMKENPDLPHETSSRFFRDVRNFYEALVDKILQKFPFKDPVLQSLAFLNPETKMKVSATAVVELGQRFLGAGVSLDSLEEEFLDYQLAPAADLPGYVHGETPMTEYWVKMSEKKVSYSQKGRFVGLASVALVCLTLPHSNADTERSFSVLRKIQQDSRGNLAMKTVAALMSSKMNNDEDCFRLKPPKALLSAARSACISYSQGLQELSDTSVKRV